MFLFSLRFDAACGRRRVRVQSGARALRKQRLGLVSRDKPGGHPSLGNREQHTV